MKNDKDEEGFYKVGKPRFEKGEVTIIILRKVPVKRKSQDYATDEGQTHTQTDYALLTSKMKDYALTKAELIEKFYDTAQEEFDMTFYTYDGGEGSEYGEGTLNLQNQPPVEK